MKTLVSTAMTILDTCILLTLSQEETGEAARPCRHAQLRSHGESGLWPKRLICSIRSGFHLLQEKKSPEWKEQSRRCVVAAGTVKRTGMDVWRVGLKLPARLMISRSWFLTQRVIQEFYVFNSLISCRISSRKLLRRDCLQKASVLMQSVCLFEYSCPSRLTQLS